MRARIFYLLTSVFLLVGVLIGGSALPGRAEAQPMVRSAHCEWEKPVRHDSPIDHYEIEVRKMVGRLILETVPHGPIEGTEFDIDLEYGYTYRFHVRAIAANGDVSPWSVWSNFYEPDTRLDEHVGE